MIAIAALSCAVLIGCGGTEAPADSQALESAESALVTCSATCANGSTLSCTGNSCSAENDSYVQCDGNYQHCPPPNHVQCQWFRATSWDSYAAACADAIQQGTDYCAAHGGVQSRGRACLTTPDDNPYVAANYICCNN
ncbi:hypothetical protein ACLESD_05935 [Pyxidicoccus sp. 3LFB2]